MKCLICSKPTSHRFIVYSFTGGESEHSPRASYRRGRISDKQENGSFPCCLVCETRIREEILAERNKLEGSEGWNLARITNQRRKNGK